MGRIAGHYVWDDDSLRPGESAKGGLHQNLFDANNHLAGSARFVPADEDDDDWCPPVDESTYVPADERRLSTGAQQALDDSIARLMATVFNVVSEHGPDLVRAARAAASQRYKEWRARREARRAAAGRAGETRQGSCEPAGRVQVRPTRTRMSMAEAQARTLAALGAQAFSDEQLRLVENADIIGGDLNQIGPALALLPAGHVKALLSAMAKDPTLLEEESLAMLASILDRATIPELDRREDL